MMKDKIRALVKEQADLSVMKNIPDELIEKIEKAAELLSPSDDEDTVLRTAEILLYDLFENFSEPETWGLSFSGNSTACVKIHKDLPDVHVQYETVWDGDVFVPLSGITSTDPGCEEMVKIFANQVAEMVARRLDQAA